MQVKDCEGRPRAVSQSCGLQPPRFLPRQTYRHSLLVICFACPKPGDLSLSTQGFSGLPQMKPELHGALLSACADGAIWR
jgi:hypothetical protein